VGVLAATNVSDPASRAASRRDARLRVVRLGPRAQRPADPWLVVMIAIALRPAAQRHVDPGMTEARASSPPVTFNLALSARNRFFGDLRAARSCICSGNHIAGRGYGPRRLSYSETAGRSSRPDHPVAGSGGGTSQHPSGFGRLPRACPGLPHMTRLPVATTPRASARGGFLLRG
jgi:hypothetical protein